jgi:glucosyl-3-phosphoglycerate synthase
MLGEHRQSVAVIIPAKNEAATIGSVLDAVRQRSHLVDELVVVNDHSADDTATVAEHHGARVVNLDSATGKGGALLAGLAETTSELVVFLDADVLNTTPDYVPFLLAPLVLREEIQMVKGYYVRPLHDMPSGGGRVNELTARPILSLLYPGLGEIRQPLAGETALRRSVLNEIALASAYGIEIALLLDTATQSGVNAIAQVDLGVRRHRNRPLEELSPMATDILRLALTRFGVHLPAH